METYKELRERHQKEIEALPLGFAFSDKQFEEMKQKLGVTDNSELRRLGTAGTFYRKADQHLILDTFERHEEERQAAIFTPSGINTAYLEEMFYYEMCNHEYGINWDGDEEVLEACCLTAKQMDEHPELRNAWNTAKARYWKDAEENDWF